jgi:hypothetical protein
MIFNSYRFCYGSIMILLSGLIGLCGHEFFIFEATILGAGILLVGLSFDTDKK